MSRCKPFGIAVLCVAFVAGIVATGGVRADDDKTVTLTEKDSGKKVSLAKGEILTLKLETTAGTGFTWVLAKHDKDKLPQEGKVETIPAKKGVVGGKATMVFRFKAEGASDLELQYKRVFEKDKEPAKVFKVSVEIK